MIARPQYKLSPAELSVLLALVRRGTLAGAGGLLGIDASTVFRTVQRTEKGLKQRLFDRSRAGYRPTDLALQLAPHAERIEAELESARSATQSAGLAVTGSVRISTTDTLLHALVMPALRSFAFAHPQLQFELRASNELASLTRRDADIAVRATQRPPGHLVGRHLGPIRVAVYAALPIDLRRAPRIELAEAPWIAPDAALPEHPSVRWRKRNHPRVVPKVEVDSISAVLHGVLAGLGVGVLPLFLARGREDLVALTPPLADAESQLWLLTHPQSRHLRRIAAVAAHLGEHVRLE